MTPRLLRSDATAFDNLGFGALTHTISCIVKEELGVAPTLEMSLLNDDPNFVNVEVGNIIAVEPNKNDPIQAFVIEEISKPIDGIVTIYATHIAQHRGKLIPVAPFTATDLDTALSLMVSSSLESNPFTLVRDEGKNNVVATMHPTVPHSFRELMGGVEGSILDTYRGEWKYDNFTCTLYNKRGRDNGVRVMYGRNMSDFKLEEQFNWDNSATGVIGYWVDSESGTTVIGDIQYSDYADLYPYKKTVCVDFSDKWESAPSVTDLNTYALSWINGKGLYGASVTVAFEHLNVEGGADIGLGDTVHIFNGTYNFEMESRIVGLEYDVLAEEYTSVTIGEQRTTLNEAIADIGGGTTSSGGGGGASVDPSTTLPLMDGTAAIGTEQTYARGDHVHPTDTSRVDKTGDSMTGSLGLLSSVIDEDDATPSATQSAPAIAWRDKNNTTLTTMRMRRLNATYNGAIVNTITISRGGVSHVLNLGIDDSNKRFVWTNAAPQWREAIEISGGYLILGVQNINCSSSGQVADKATATCTGTRTAVSGADGYWYIPRYCNYGIPINAPSVSGNTVSINAMNTSGASRTLQVNVMIIAYKSL